MSELINVADDNPEVCTALKARLLKLLSETREPYFDVLIEHGVKPQPPVRDVSPSGASVLVPCPEKLSPAWKDMIIRPRDADG